ncbi:hypothetical protein J4Q44_G00346810, partial [Coregonus suidteri]
QVTSVLPNLPNEVHYVCRTQIKEVVLPTDVIKVLESDFVERASEDEHLSQEDLQFMSIMESGIRLKDDGHYEMPLPFKKGRPNLPDNKVCGIHRLRCLEKKLKGNEQYCRDYKTFMDETIASEDNPADHASRGVTAEQLTASNWFTGPDLLWLKELPTGVVMVGEIESSDPEVKKAQVHDTQAEEAKTILDRLHKFSDWARMVKAVARLKRCAKEIKGLKPKSCEASNLEERKEAELTIIKMVQEATLSQEIQRLRHHKETKVKDKANQLHKLCPFLDDQGVIRVGGRLANAALHPHVRHPAVLPRDSHVSALLVKHYHERVYHQGRGMTINELRSNGIWILGCSKLVSSHIHKCTSCRRFRRCTEQQRMADLPEERMETTAPFTYCGMDCFGPFHIKEGRKELKRYGLLLTCMCSRGVHIEALDDLTSDAFINALRSFIAIRGSVRQIRCDQGTNFVGARREFIEALKEMDQEELKDLGCEFIMNTPASSHMGGVWERQIRTTEVSWRPF